MMNRQFDRVDKFIPDIVILDEEAGEVRVFEIKPCSDLRNDENQDLNSAVRVEQKPPFIEQAMRHLEKSLGRRRQLGSLIRGEVNRKPAQRPLPWGIRVGREFQAESVAERHLMLLLEESALPELPEPTGHNSAQSGGRQ